MYMIVTSHYWYGAVYSNTIARFDTMEAAQAKLAKLTAAFGPKYSIIH